MLAKQCSAHRVAMFTSSISSVAIFLTLLQGGLQQGLISCTMSSVLVAYSTTTNDDISLTFHLYLCKNIDNCFQPAKR